MGGRSGERPNAAFDAVTEAVARRLDELGRAAGGTAAAHTSARRPDGINAWLILGIGRTAFSAHQRVVGTLA
jgi:hypothetical protein